LELQNTKKIPEEKHWLISHTACMQAANNNNNVRAVCTWVLGYLLFTLYFLFSCCAKLTID
jgi:hypothetical protein